MYGTVTANIGGRVRTLKFNLNADFEYCKMHHITLNDMQKQCLDPLNVTVIRDKIYCALKVVDMQQHNIIDYDEYTVGEWLEKMPESELSIILNGEHESTVIAEGGKKKEEES